MSKQSIGLFDSGLGGLTIMKALSELLPWENMIYLADQAHFPYGEKDPSNCFEYSLGCAQVLAKQDVKLIIIACHSATAAALETVQKHVSIPVIGVIEENTDLNQHKNVAILGTQTTIASKVYESLIDARTISLACPEFVRIIENGLEKSSSTYSIAKNVLKPLIGEVDAALLACTHFPMMKDAIQEALGENVALIDPSESCIKKAFQILKTHSLLNQIQTIPTYQFITTGPLKKFKELTQKFWDEKDGKKEECVKLFLKSDSFLKGYLDESEKADFID